MDEAIVVFSRKGIFQTTIAARDVRSREHARKLWPLVSPDASRQMVTWVSPSFEGRKLRRRSHFRVLPTQHTFNPKSHFDFHHAEAALGYCDVLLTDGPMHALLRQRNLAIERDFTCRVMSSAEEAADWVRCRIA